MSLVIPFRGVVLSFACITYIIYHMYILNFCILFSNAQIFFLSNNFRLSLHSVYFCISKYFVLPSRNFTPLLSTNSSQELSLLSQQLAYSPYSQVSASTAVRVVLESVGVQTAGVYTCEVMADDSFETVRLSANMTVIGELT